MSSDICPFEAVFCDGQCVPCTFRCGHGGPHSFYGAVQMDDGTEPDAAEREALDAALTAPIPPASDPITRAVIAERERIAEVAEALGAHYHDGDGGRSAPFANLLRGEHHGR